jgi:hypothetical protein
LPVLVPLLARAGSRPKIAPRADIRYGDTQAARNCRSLLNLQQNDSSVIGSRLVCHFGGYDPVSPMNTYLRFVRELQRFRQTWSVMSSASAPSVAADRAKWRIVSNGPNWRVETDHQLFRWDDIMAVYARRPGWSRLPMGLLAFDAVIPEHDVAAGRRPRSRRRDGPRFAGRSGQRWRSRRRRHPRSDRRPESGDSVDRKAAKIRLTRVLVVCRPIQNEGFG